MKRRKLQLLKEAVDQISEELTNTQVSDHPRDAEIFSSISHAKTQAMDHVYAMVEEIETSPCQREESSNPCLAPHKPGLADIVDQLNQARDIVGSRVWALEKQSYQAVS